MTSTVKHMLALQDEAHKKDLESADPTPFDYLGEVFKKGLRYGMRFG